MPQRSALDGKPLGPLDSFGALIAPVPEATFFSTYYESEALHVPHDDPTRYAALLEAIDVEDLIHQCKTWGEVSLAGGERGRMACDLAAPPNPEHIGLAFQQGFTVVLNDLQTKTLQVARLCRMLEARFFCRANVNLYLTRRGIPGLDVHYDDDDVLVLQLRGEKIWRTWPSEQRLPMGDSPYQNIDVQGPGARHVLKPGDVLYVPRGAPHQAVAGQTDSLHLTVSLNVLRYAHLLRELVLVVADKTPDLRKAIAPDVLRSGQGWPEDMISRFLAALGQDSDIVAAIGRAQTRLLTGAPRLPRPWSDLEAQGPVRADTYVRVADDQIWGLTPTADLTIIRGLGAQFEFPPQLSDVAGHLERGKPFNALGLSADLTIRRRQEIIQTLLDSGFLILDRPGQVAERPSNAQASD